MSRALDEETALTDQTEATGDTTGPSPATRIWSGRIHNILVALVVLAGICGAVRVWLSDRGLWNDELYIAINVRDLSIRGLFGPLQYYQIAPPGWLVGEKAFLRVLGDSEQALRLPALIGTVAAIVLAVVAARRAAGPWATLVTAALVVFSPLTMTYAGELKQYSIEAAVALALILAADTYASDDRAGIPRWRRAVGWMVVGVVGGLLSYTALLVVTGLVVSVVGFLLIRRRRPELWVFLLASVPVLAVCITLVVRRLLLPQLSNQFSFFQTGVPPAHSGVPQIIGWLPRMWGGFIGQATLGWTLAPLVLLLVVGGLVALVLRGRLLWAAMLALVPLAAIGAAAVHGFPVEGRVALYLLAPIAILIAACVDGTIRGAAYVFRALKGGELPDRWWSRTRPVAATIAVVLAVAAVVSVGGTAVAAAPAAVSGVGEVVQPFYRDRGRDVVRDVAGRLKPGDVVLFYQFSKPLAAWYGRQLKMPIVGLAQMGPQDASCKPDTVAKSLTGASRVWYVHGARLSTHPNDYHERVLAVLTKSGTVVTSKSFGPPRATLILPGWTLLDLKAGPAKQPVTVPPNPKFACLSVIPLK
ncbi:glycosyltransferase family 39 protein [Fodinicola acaciae]|uniref:glycosyltransferase family 39 protein n=1 Tax=Fodinicola acaciae TaxID=2681555 RepID=UPI0013D6EF8C|nr:glycosyltransferase family 39 protein [Fodinicola acaciae]